MTTLLVRNSISPATMLLKDFLKEHRTVHDLKKEVAALTATVKEQASQIQKLSARVQVSKPGLQKVVDNQ